MSRRPRTYSSPTLEALRLLGARTRQGRIERRWTVQELADRVGISLVTMRRIEHGAPTVEIGVAFEAASIVGVALFDDDAMSRRLEAERVDGRLAVLPKTVRRPNEVDDDF
jgi:transcriptional regulator with XRE-family HTH domain